MKAWRNANIGFYWSLELDVQDLCGHLEVTLRAWAGTLTKRVKDAICHVTDVGAFTKGFQRMLGMACSKNLLAGLHGGEGASISVSAPTAFRSRAVCSKQFPMTNTPTLLPRVGSKPKGA